MKVSGTASWIWHNPRKTGTTMLDDMGELADIIEATLTRASIRSKLGALDGSAPSGAKIVPLGTVTIYG